MVSKDVAKDAVSETVHRVGCPLCEASCGLRITLRSRADSPPEILDIRGERSDPLSRGYVCPKGVALQDLHTDPRRLKRPLRRQGQTWIEIDWDEAIERVAEGLADVQRAHGQDAVAVYLGNPNVHSLGALTHGLHVVRTLRSKNTYSATSVDQLPHQMAAWALYGHQFLLPVPDLDRTQLLILIGHNPMASNGSLWTVPDFPARVRELRARGGQLIVLDPRRTETAAVADEYHPVRPGTDAVLLLAMLWVVLAERLDTAAEYVHGQDAVRQAIEPFTPEQAERVCGVPADVVRDLARRVASRRAAVHGRMGVSTQEFGLVSQWAIQVLHALTGNLDRPGGVMFTHPAIDLLPMLGRGHHDRWRSRVRGLPEFGGELPVSTMADEMLAPGPGQVRALLTVAGNPVSSTPDGARLAKAIDGLDFYAAIDPYLNATTRRADVVLPPTGPLERDHYDLFFHALAVRNVARFSPALFERDDHARHDWEISRDLVRALYAAKGERAPLKTTALLQVSPRATIELALRASRGGLSVKKLLDEPADLGPLRSCLPERLHTEDQRIDLSSAVVLRDLPRVRARLLETHREATQELLLIGRRHQRDNNSWMGGIDRLTRGRSRHHLLIHPADAAARGISTGGMVTIRSAVGEVRVECQVSAEMMAGVVSLPHGYGYDRPGASLNDLTDPGVLDRASGNAVLNGVAVIVSPESAAAPGSGAGSSLSEATARNARSAGPDQ